MTRRIGRDGGRRSSFTARGHTHLWVRDDANTKQCIRCGEYAPVEGEE